VQEKVRKFLERRGRIPDPETALLDLLAETGELAKALLKANDYGKQVPTATPEIAEELGDALYSLLTFAESLGIDAEAALQAALEKCARRIAERGTMGSEGEGGNP